MAAFNRLAVLVLGAALVSATAIPKRAVPPFFYFSFGDSYTTTSFDINGVQPGPGHPLGNPAYGKGTHSGGPNYVDFLATKYNSSYVSAYDFAVGGATISDSVVKNSNPDIPPFERQVGQRFEPKYTSPHVGNWNSNNAIFSVFFGINDIGIPFLTGKQVEAASTRIPALLNAYFAVCDNLYRQGARRFMFVGVPPTDRSPLVIGQLSANSRAQMRDFINNFNGQLTTRIHEWTGNNTGAVAAIYDYHKWLSGVLDNPGSLGFPNATCVNSDGQSCIWWNSYHVGSKLNAGLAKRMQPAMNSLGFDGRTPVGGYFY